MATTTPARVDEEITKCRALLSHLCSQKNSFLPIFRLLPEILANVFIYGARDYYEAQRDHCPTFRVPDWLDVSYVCRHWRNVALNCPTLWTYHFTVSPRWTEELLARSKQASLKIYIYTRPLRDRYWLPRLVEKVLNHADRIQELCLVISRDVLPTGLSLNAPRLQILDIDTWGCSSEQTLTINNGDTLPLRTLKLNACPLSWHSTFNLSGVSTLFLCDIPSPSQLNIMEFLATLSRMQALTVLHLECALPSARGFLSSGACSVSSKVSLPFLTRLFVCAPLSTDIALLSWVDIPLNTQIKLEIEPEDSASIDDYVQITSIVAQRFKDMSSISLAIRSLVIHFGYGSKFIFTASERGDYKPNLSMQIPSKDCNISLMIFQPLVMTNNLQDIMSDICCAIPSTHVQTLQIVNPPFSPDFWRKMLGHFDGLRYMKLRNGCMPDLASLLSFTADGPVEALRGHTTSGRGPTTGHTFVPALEELELCSIAFGSKNDLPGKTISEKSLLDALSTRKTLHLTMTNC